MEIGNGIAIAGIWIACGIYAYAKKDSEILWVSSIMTALLVW